MWGLIEMWMYSGGLEHVLEWGPKKLALLIFHFSIPLVLCIVFKWYASQPAMGPGQVFRMHLICLLFTPGVKFEYGIETCVAAGRNH